MKNSNHHYNSRKWESQKQNRECDSACVTASWGLLITEARALGDSLKKSSVIKDEISGVTSAVLHYLQVTLPFLKSPTIALV